MELTGIVVYTNEPTEVGELFNYQHKGVLEVVIVEQTEDTFVTREFHEGTGMALIQHYLYKLTLQEYKDLPTGRITNER